MRIAIAGTGGLARLLALRISQETSHQIVLLSRSTQVQLQTSFQVAIVRYDDQVSLRYALRGVHTVISTVTGLAQIELIKAAVGVGVARFAPAEFEGRPDQRPPDSPFDRGRQIAQRLLSYYGAHIQSTNFVCGVLYERFQPGGLQVSRLCNIDGLNGEGDFMINCRSMQAAAPLYDEDDKSEATICLTSVRDVACFVVKALDMPQWPSELRMCGYRTTVRALLEQIQQMRGIPLTSIQWHNSESLRSQIHLSAAQQDIRRQVQLHALLATAQGQYNFVDFNLNAMFPQIQPISFDQWFLAKWANET